MDAMIEHEAMNATTTENEMIAKRLKERIGCTPNYITPELPAIQKLHISRLSC